VLGDTRHRGIDRVIHLGDVVGYNSRPRETLALLRQEGIAGVRGNHDLMALGRLPPDHCGPVGREAIAWTKRALTDTDREYLACLPPELRLDGGIICVHSALSDPVVRLESGKQFSDQALLLRSTDPGLNTCFTGHTHVQRLIEVSCNGVVTRHEAAELGLDRKAFWFVNPGSVGQPRDGDARAAYAVLDLETRRVSFHRVAYDVGRITRENARRRLGLRLRASLVRSLVGRLFRTPS